MTAVTAFDVAVARGAKANEDGSISGAEFDRVGIPLLGGCQGCGESLGAFNGYPSTTGYWRCRGCLGDRGFETVDAFARWLNDQIGECDDDPSGEEEDG